jgi:signal transduction histidine kinase/ligand-binding sensor domain-containing protein/CheY-like chemotaxis protein/AraC-like DNA-binding protein
MKKTLQHYLVILLFFLAREVSSQTREVSFNLVTTSDGAIQSKRPQAITQDKYGFLWIADQSQKAIFRYDGHHMKMYRHDFKNPNSLGGHNPECLATDSLGNIWIGFYGTGLDKFDPVTGVFTHYRHDPKDIASLSSDVVSAVLVDHLGNVWVGSNGGLDLIDQKTGKFKNYKHHKIDSTSLSYDVVRSIYEDKSGELWVGTGTFFSDPKFGGLNHFHRNSETFTRYLSDPANPHALIDNRVKAMFEDSYGTFWVGTNRDGLHTLDRKTGLFKRLTYDPKQPELLSRPPFMNDQDHISFITEDSDKKIWIGTWQNGLTRYDPITKKITRYGNNDDKSNSINIRYSWNIYTASDGLLWLMVPSVGLVKIDINNTIIPHVDMAGKVWDFYEQGDSIGWYATEKGLVRKDYRMSTSRVYVHDPANPNSLSNSVTTRIRKDKTGNLWIGTYNGLNHFNVKTEKFTRYNDNVNAQNAVSGIYEDSDSTLWLTYFCGGLEFYNWKSGKRTFYLNDPGDPHSISWNCISAFYKDDSNDLWLGTIAWKGLNKFNRTSGKFKHYLPGEYINCIYGDASGIMWVGTNAGLYYYNKPSDSFIEIDSEINGSIIGSVLAITGDKEDNLWMSTSNWIYMLNKKRDHWYHYGKEYGFIKNEFTSGSSFTSHDGEINLGDPTGYYAFYPEKLKKIASKNTPLYFTGFWLNNKVIIPGTEGPLKMPLNQTNEIRLDYNQNVFSFSATYIDFRNTQDKFIHYKLDQFDIDWRKARSDDEIQYIKVPPGKYIFRVKGSNVDGILNEQGISITITILPPWWRTWWAYICYVVLVGGSVYTFYQYQLKQRLKQAEALRLKELDEVKNKLYTNITHEFRTPLTVILGMAKQVIEHPKVHLREGLNMIIRNGQNLLTLVNQMLDLSKLESGKLSLYYERADIVTFLEYIVESFHSLAQNKGIQLHFIPEVEQIVMDFDELRFQQIVSNMLSNAIKFTPEGGHVYVSSDIKNDRFILKIKDTGIGISEADLPLIFDRFYQSDGTHTRQGEGTGIGLALTRELVKIMEGTISVKSEKGNGTEFEVSFPLLQISNVEETNQKTPLLTTNQIFETAVRMDENFLPALTTLVNNDKSSSIDRPHILIADDNEDVRTYLKACLNNDYVIEIAQNGQECEDLAFNSIPDLIVLDVMMPFKDGIEVCKSLKSDERTSHIPIIMLTAKADLDSRLDGLEQGADDYLTKPFNKKELLLRIRNLLELRRQLQQYYISTFKASLLQDNAPSAENPLPTSGSFLKGVEKGYRNPSIPLVNSLENAFVIKVRKAIETHLDSPDFDVEKLCRHLAMSHSQVHRKLSALTGLSATHFIRYVRLVKAKEMINSSGYSIAAIAMDCGFNDPAYFSRVFKQEFGVTPYWWREKNSG